jgi:AhpD family alkylhydroperoxidase
MQSAWQRSTEVRGEAVFIEAAGNAPELYDWYAEFYQRVFYGGRVPVRHKELARLKLSTLHGCAYCNRGNREDARRAGLSLEQITAIDDPDSAVFSEAERDVLRLAERVSLAHPEGTLDEGLYRDLRRHFDDAQIFELGMTMAVLTGMAKFLFTFDLVSKEPYCQFGVSP